jgi:putrescine importer
LKLWHLVVYGIVIMQPTAPMGFYGVVSNVAGGHVVTTILIAGVAMLFTALSYGRMARVYPSAGSAYTYVGKELNPVLGFVVGWSLLMDYVLNPIICAIWFGAAAQNVLPSIPFATWAVSFVILLTLLNLRGVKMSGRINALLAFAMSVAVVIFLAEAIHYIALVVRPVAGQWLLPFYDPTTFNVAHVFHGTSIAVLAYIGFDSISTMSEEVENPRSNIILATVFVCLIIGILSAVEVYSAQLAWPMRGPFPSSMVDTAYVFVARRVGGPILFHLLNITLMIANVGSGMAAQFGATRLLYGMGRANALPRRIFGVVDVRTGVPRNNVIIVGVCALLGVFMMSYQSGAELLNFGAFIGFMGVNAAALVHYKYRSKEKVLLPAAIPLLGFAISAFIWFNLSRKTKFFGTAWIGIGLALYYIMHRMNAGFDKLHEIEEQQ